MKVSYIFLVFCFVFEAGRIFGEKMIDRPSFFFFFCPIFTIIGPYECVVENKVGTAYSEMASLHVRSM